MLLQNVRPGQGSCNVWTRPILEAGLEVRVKIEKDRVFSNNDTVWLLTDNYHRQIDRGWTFIFFKFSMAWHKFSRKGLIAALQKPPN